jgi:hypothetical protein
MSMTNPLLTKLHNIEFGESEDGKLRAFRVGFAP